MFELNQLRSLCFLVARLVITLGLLSTVTFNAEAQERRSKVRISNAGLTITALPLLAARDWGIFAANRMDVEIIIMAASLAPAALSQGDIDYIAGVGPASVSATLSGLPSRAIWFSSDRITYWLMSRPQLKNLEELKGKKIAVSGGLGGTNHIALVIALEKSGHNPKDYAMVAIPGQQNQLLYSLESGFVDSALISPPVTFSARKKGFNKLLDVGSMVEMPGGGLTALMKTIEGKPAETKRVIHSLQSAKEEVRKSKGKTVDLIVRLLKMDKEAAGETYDAFLTTLSPTGIPNHAGMENLVKAIQSQGRFAERKISFTEIADDRLATEVALEMGYKIQ
jgi:ABC-type nitrate/sulfonate/bicarbonate transport system substrate-binding protein